MYEARIVVSENGGNVTATLIDVTDGERILATSPCDAGSFSDGFPDLLLAEGPAKGQQLNAAALEVAYKSQKTLAESSLFGRYLYRLLTPGKISEQWEKLKARLEDQNDTLTTLLEIHPESWQSLPWELLYHRGLYLFQDREHALGLRVPGGIARRSACRWPLRMLVLIGCGEDESEKIKWEAELLAIRRAISGFSLRIDLKVKRAPISKENAGKAIEAFRPHILHFIGHGQSQNGGSLLLMDENEKNQVWTRDEIRVVLSSLKKEVPRITLLNACQSAGAEGILGDTAVAEAFAQIGCLAVIAMRGDILGQTASLFAGAFYQGLADFGIDRVDQAYCRALGAIAAQGLDQRVWSLPRIYYQESAASIFPLGGDCRGYAHVSRGYDDLLELKPFVNHEELRFEIYQQAHCWLDAEEPAHRILLVHGPKNSGKSWLLKAIVYAAALRGRRASYCSFTDRNLDLEEFFTFVRGGDPKGGSFLSGPLVRSDDGEDPFAEFDATRDQFSPSGTEDRLGTRTEKFAKGLRRLAETRPVLLAFDHIDNLKACWSYLQAPIFEAGAKGSNAGGLGSGLRLVIAVDPSERTKFSLADLKAQVVELDHVAPEKFEDYVLQFCLHRLESGEAFAESLEKCRETLQLLAANRVKSGRKWLLSSLDAIFDTMSIV